MQLSQWTAREAAALQAALRLTNEAFATKLGIAVRTVAGWHARPELRPRAEMQQLLDTLLERATVAERARFRMHLDEAATAPAEPAAPVTAQQLRVAIAIVVNDANVLLVCRRSEDPTALGWQFPAGVVKPGASAQITAEREALAETGIRCSARNHLGSRLHPATQVQCDYFLCEYLTGEPENRDPVENADVTWAPIERLTRFVPEHAIYPPVLQALEGSTHGT